MILALRPQGAYAVGMFGAGHLGDQLPLRGFLVTGMVLSGAAVCAVGAAFFLGVHELWYFVVVQVLGGAPPQCHSSHPARPYEAMCDTVG